MPVPLRMEEFHLNLRPVPKLHPITAHRWGEDCIHLGPLFVYHYPELQTSLVLGQSLQLLLRDGVCDNLWLQPTVVGMVSWLPESFLSLLTGICRGHISGPDPAKVPGCLLWELVARCSSVVRAFTYGAMGHQIDPSWWTHWDISCFTQCSTTGVTKAVVCAILFVGWCM